MSWASLRIEPAGIHRYRVVYDDRTSPALEAFFDEGAIEIDNIKWTRNSLAECLCNPAGNAEDFARIGGHLASLLFCPPILQRWQTLTQPLELSLEVPAELADLPWELLCQNGDCLFQIPLNPVHRVHEEDNALKGLDPKADSAWPLRILMLVGAMENPPTGSVSDIKAEEEIAAIELALIEYGHSIDLEVLRRPTEDEFVEVVAKYRPHVVHFIGHCENIPGQGPGLRFQLGKNAWDLVETKIKNLLRQIRTWLPRFVFLNACKTGVHLGANRGISSVFLRAGVPAVLSMQADIRGDLAGSFASELYSRIATGTRVDEAVAFARIRLVSGLEGHWAIPVLVVAKGQIEEVFPRSSCCAPPLRNSVHSVFSDVWLFARRPEDFHAIQWKLLPVDPAKTPKPLIVVTGESLYGKSHLIKWMLEGLALQEWPVRYVEINSVRPMNEVDFLRWILEQALTASLETFPPSVFDGFEFESKNLLEIGVPGHWQGEAISHPATQFEPSKLKGDKVIEQIFQSFLGCLRRFGEEVVKSQRRFVLVLDKFQDSNGGTVPARELMCKGGPIREYFLKPIAAGDIPGFHLILVMREAQLAQFEISQLALPQDWTRLSLLPKRAFRKAVSEMLWYREDKWPGLVDGLKSVDASFSDDWPAARLQLVAELAQAFSKNVVNSPKLTDVIKRMR